jgi:hypothetical protein
MNISKSNDNFLDPLKFTVNIECPRTTAIEIFFLEAYENLNTVSY